MDIQWLRQMPQQRKGLTQQASATAPANPPKAATAAPSTPPNPADMAGLRDPVQQLLARQVQLEKDFPSPSAIPVKAALLNLHAALHPLSPFGDMTALVNSLRNFVENSGIYFEKRLEQAIRTLQARTTTMTPGELAAQPAIRDLMVKDLKPNLLILRQFLDSHALDAPGMERHQLETLKSVVQRAVAHIEQQQFRATEKPADPDLFQAFSHLLLLTDTRRNARLKVYYAKKGRDDAHRHPRVSLLLDMDRLGTVRSDLWMVGQDLKVTFFVKDTAVKVAIETEHHRIGEMLKEPFHAVAVSVVVNAKKIAEFEGEDLNLSKRRQVDLNI